MILRILLKLVILVSTSKLMILMNTVILVNLTILVKLCSKTGDCGAYGYTCEYIEFC